MLPSPALHRHATPPVLPVGQSSRARRACLPAPVHPNAPVPPSHAPAAPPVRAHTRLHPRWLPRLGCCSAPGRAAARACGGHCAATPGRGRRGSWWRRWRSGCARGSWTWWSRPTGEGGRRFWGGKGFVAEPNRGTKAGGVNTSPKQVELAEHRQRRQMQAGLLMGGGRGVVEQQGEGHRGRGGGPFRHPHEGANLERKLWWSGGCGRLGRAGVGSEGVEIGGGGGVQTGRRGGVYDVLLSVNVVVKACGRVAVLCCCGRWAACARTPVSHHHNAPLTAHVHSTSLTRASRPAHRPSLPPPQPHQRGPSGGPVRLRRGRRTGGRRRPRLAARCCCCCRWGRGGGCCCCCYCSGCGGGSSSLGPGGAGHAGGAGAAVGSHDAAGVGGGRGVWRGGLRWDGRRRGSVGRCGGKEQEQQ